MGCIPFGPKLCIDAFACLIKEVMYVFVAMAPPCPDHVCSLYAIDMVPGLPNFDILTNRGSFWILCVQLYLVVQCILVTMFLRCLWNFDFCRTESSISFIAVVRLGVRFPIACSRCSGEVAELFASILCGSILFSFVFCECWDPFSYYNP